MSMDAAADYLFDLLHSPQYHRLLFGLDGDRQQSDALLAAIHSAADTLKVDIPKGDPVVAFGGNVTNFKVNTEDEERLKKADIIKVLIIHEGRVYVEVNSLPFLRTWLYSNAGFPSILSKVDKVISRETEKTPEESAGLLLRKEGKILLVHPTGSAWEGTFSIPKGHLQKGEDARDAAVRETREETGLDVSSSMVKGEPHKVFYRNESGALTKVVYAFEANAPSSWPDVIPKGQLQLDEVDYAAFLPKKEARTKIFRRFKHLLSLV
jgi:ADP-ribose pyrophosphatase YjhB (NUDIX family)